MDFVNVLDRGYERNRIDDDARTFGLSNWGWILPFIEMGNNIGMQVVLRKIRCSVLDMPFEMSLRNPK